MQKLQHHNSPMFRKDLALVHGQETLIDFQKKATSQHIHLLIILKQNSKLLTADAVDRYILAEIPDPDLQPFLHCIIL